MQETQGADQLHTTAMNGRLGGLAVKNMIQAVEEKMAGGARISAAPSSREEAERLARVREENRLSAQQSGAAR